MYSSTATGISWMVCLGVALGVATRVKQVHAGDARDTNCQPVPLKNHILLPLRIAASFSVDLAGHFGIFAAARH